MPGIAILPTNLANQNPTPNPILLPSSYSLLPTNKMTSKPKSPKPYDYKRSFNYAIWLLSRRAYTEKGISDKLTKKQASSEVITKVIAKLKDLKYIDDAGFAEMYINSRKNSKGARALKQELWRKGVNEEIINNAISEISEETQLEAAINIVRRESWRFKKGDKRKDWARAHAFLARRGFSVDTCKTALEKSKLFEPDD